MTRPGRIVLAAVLLFAAHVSAQAAVRYDPRLHFRTIRTAHFDIHAHQGEEGLARRLAAVAERVRARLGSSLGFPSGRVQVILVDQSDLSNGWATPVPYDAIEITARPPETTSLLGNSTDWLELVFTHEYTHIVHLDRSRGFLSGIHRVFGRVPIAFPNLFLPQWQVEGLATFEESRLTGEGRVRTGDFRLLVDAAARAQRFERADRVSGGLDDWPDGEGAYAYGALFHQYLADRYGAERIAALRDATAGRLPYFGSGAYKHVYGKPFRALWNEFERSRAATGSSSNTDAAATRLTTHGFVVDALTSDGDDVFYRVSTPHGYPALMRLSPGRPPVRIAWRYEGNRTTIHGGWVVFDQVAPVRAVGWFSDLYAVRSSGGHVYRLTRETRAADPAFSPDGVQIACTVEHEGHVALAIVPFTTTATSVPRIIAADGGADFGAPAWMPDGRTLVAERRSPGVFQLVAVDAASRDVRVLLTARTRLATPTALDDGRTILFTSDPAGQPLNVFALDTISGAVRQVTDSTNGARLPHMAAGGRTLYYVGYTTNGYDVFSVPAPRTSWRPVAVDAWTARDREAAPPDSPATPPDTSHPYSPWPTMKPTYWSPVLATDAGELVVGAGTAMSDALGRHAYAASAGWSTRARPDWQVAYAYDRWRPTLFASYSDDTDPVAGGEVRSEEFTAGALLTFRWLRRSETIFGGVDAERDSLACDGPCRVRVTSANRVSARGGWLHDTRRAFGYSISAEEGHALSLAMETSVAGAAASARAAVLDGRVFRRMGRGHTVLAVRGASALAWGPLAERRVFSAAGAGPASPGVGFGRDAIGLLRGVAPDDVVGTRAAVANVDLRVPLAYPQHGAGAFPLFVRALHAAVFVDAGTAWDAAVRAADVRTAVGGEGAIDLVLGHYLPVTLAMGAAWTRDPVARRSGAAVFGRIGHAF